MHLFGLPLVSHVSMQPFLVIFKFFAHFPLYCFLDFWLSSHSYASFNFHTQIYFICVYFYMIPWVFLSDSERDLSASLGLLSLLL